MLNFYTPHQSLIMKKALTTIDLISSAKEFCSLYSKKYFAEFFGVTDGKAIGTLVEHLYKDFLIKHYELTIGNSASGLDLPSVNTDIKVTSIKQPQSSCPFKDSKQKIYGLGYNLIVFVYEKYDDQQAKRGMLNFVSCSFIPANRTADYQMTTALRRIIANNGNEDDIFAFLSDHKVPADDVTLINMSKQILNCPPEIGYLTISNALQWRLQYGRVVAMTESKDDIVKII